MTTRLGWQAVAPRGGAAVLFGVLTIINPGATLATLVLLFGVFLLVAPGIGALAVAIWIGAYALFVGVLPLAFRLRGLARGGARTLAASR